MREISNKELLIGLGVAAAIILIYRSGGRNRNGGNANTGTSATIPSSAMPPATSVSLPPAIPMPITPSADAVPLPTPLPSGLGATPAYPMATIDNEWAQLFTTYSPAKLQNITNSAEAYIDQHALHNAWLQQQNSSCFAAVPSTMREAIYAVEQGMPIPQNTL